MPSGINIVVVEDNLSLQDLMVDHLSKGGYHVEGVSTAEELDELLVSARVDILVLDINLPGEDGLSIAQRLHAVNPNLYIIMLTARSSEKDVTIGYESGADIYLTKPVSPIELSATISGIERRIKLLWHEKSGLTLDVQRMQLVGPQGVTDLGGFEFALLKGLIEASNQRLEYWRMMELIEKEPTEKSKTALGVQIFRLKQKLLQVGGGESAIKSIHKEGYQLGVIVRLI